MGLNILKTNLREKYSAIRANESKNVKKLKAVNGALASFLKNEVAKTVGFYMPIRGEIDISDVIRAWLKDDARRLAALPVVEDKETKRMRFCVWRPEDRLQAREYGILSPALGKEVVPELIIAPCLAFNAQRVRLGYGGGYFDRYLKTQRKKGHHVKTLLIAFDALYCEELKADAFDIPFDAVLTETNHGATFDPTEFSS